MAIASLKPLHRTVTTIPLRWVLVLPFVLQTVGAVALVGYLSNRSGQQAVTALAKQLMQEKGDRIVQNLNHYFEAPKNLTREHQAAIKLGILDWQNISLIETYFVKQLNIHKSVSGLMITTESKKFLAVGHPQLNQLAIRERNGTGILENYAANLQGKRLYLQDSLPNFNPHQTPRVAPWYRKAKAAKDGLWQLVVSVVGGQEPPLLMLAYFLPFEDPQGNKQGILSSSAYLDQTGKFLRDLQIGKAGQAFIVDEQGQLIATSTSELPFRQGVAAVNPRSLAPEALRVAAQESQDPVTRAAAVWSTDLTSRNQDSQITGFRWQNKQYFGQAIPFKLDNQIHWKIVVVVPESDFMTEIQANNAQTVFLCWLTLFATTAMGILTARWITKPILRLNQASKALAQGEWHQTLSENTPIAELKSLTRSFNQTADQLQQSFERIKIALEQSEEKFAKVFHNSPDPIALATLEDGRCVEVNDSFLLLLEYSREEVIGQRFVDLGIWENLDDRAKLREALHQHGYVRNLEVRSCTRTGKIKTLLVSSELIEINGETYSLGIAKDISEAKRDEVVRKQVEEQLRKTEQWLQQFSRQVPGNIYTLVHEPNGHVWFEYMNGAIEALHEISIEQVLHDASIVLNAIHPDDQHGYQTAVLESMQTMNPFSYQWRIVTPSGKIKWVQGNSQPERRQNGAIAWHGVVQEITERKQAEAALRESEERFRLAFDDAAIGMAIVGLDGGFLKVNRSFCEMLGYSQAELLQGDFQTLTHPDDLNADLVNVQRLLNGEQRSFQMEKRYIHRQGYEIWAILSASVIRDQNHNPLYFVSQIQDISDRHSAERVKDEFISVVSHELRTPLTSIRGSLGILATGALDSKPETAQRMLAVAVNNSERLVRLVNDILDLERLESGKVELEMKVCEVKDLMKQARESVLSLANEAFVTLKLMPISAKILANEAAIIQVLTNLLGNAIKFSAEGSTVWLKAELQDRQEWNGEAMEDLCPHTPVCMPLCPDSTSMILFSITDQGRGIPAEKLETIFGRFQQVDASDARQKGGTGLGLAICKSIVRQHQGQIWAESVVAQGSTFYFTIPRSPNY